MTVEEAVLNKLKALPHAKQLELLEFAESLQQKDSSTSAYEAEREGQQESLEGALAHLGVRVSAADIDEARRQLWGEFPRKITPEHTKSPFGQVE